MHALDKMAELNLHVGECMTELKWHLKERAKAKSGDSWTESKIKARIYRMNIFMCKLEFRLDICNWSIAIFLFS